MYNTNDNKRINNIIEHTKEHNSIHVCFLGADMGEDVREEIANDMNMHAIASQELNILLAERVKMRVMPVHLRANARGQKMLTARERAIEAGAPISAMSHQWR